MELKRRLNPRVIFVVVYILAFAAYIMIGLRSAEAANHVVSAELNIPEIGLTSDVAELTRNGDELTTPDQIVGSYSRANNKTLLIGHSTTVFRNLSNVKLGAEVNYDNTTYKVVAIDMAPKSNVNMNKILAGTDKNTIIIMTCAGQLLGDSDATHRLMVTAIEQ